MKELWAIIPGSGNEVTRSHDEEKSNALTAGSWDQQARRVGKADRQASLDLASTSASKPRSKEDEKAERRKLYPVPPEAAANFRPAVGRELVEHALQVSAAKRLTQGSVAGKLTPQEQISRLKGANAGAESTGPSLSSSSEPPESFAQSKEPLLQSKPHRDELPLPRADSVLAVKESDSTDQPFEARGINSGKASPRIISQHNHSPRQALDQQTQGDTHSCSQSSREPKASSAGSTVSGQNPISQGGPTVSSRSSHLPHTFPEDGLRFVFENKLDHTASDASSEALDPCSPARRRDTALKASFREPSKTANRIVES